MSRFLDAGAAPMRVVILCDVRWFNACAWHAVELARGLGEAGHDVLLAASAGSPPAREAAARGVTVVELPLERAGPGRLARGVRALAALAREHGTEILDAHRAEGFLAATLAARRMERTVAVVRTRTDVRAPKRHLLNRVLHRRGADAIGAGAAFMRADFAALGVSDDRVRVIHPGVAPEHFVPGAMAAEAAVLRAGLGGGAGPLVGVVGRLTAVKGHAVFVDAAAALATSWPAARFVIAGEAWDVSREELEQRAAAHGVRDRFHFLERLPDVRPLLEALDVVVVASTGSEAVSRVALEAMALARPLAATAVGSLPELLADDAGVLVPPGDAAALAAALDGLLSDPAAAAAMGWGGRRRVEARFNREHAVRATVDLYAEALRRVRRRQG